MYVYYTMPQPTSGRKKKCVCVCVCVYPLYYSAVVLNWKQRCPGAGVNVRFKHGRKLVGDRTAKSRLTTMRVTESQFADDTAVYTRTSDAFEQATNVFIQTANDWGLTVNINKTKGMVVGHHSNESEVSPLQVNGGTIEMVNKFPYLGSTISKDGELEEEVSNRIARASKAFGSLRSPIFQNHKLCVNQTSCLSCSSYVGMFMLRHGLLELQTLNA